MYEVRAPVSIADQLDAEDLPYIATDDRRIERVGGWSCGHRKCLVLGVTCRAYSEATLAITDADERKARELIADGWWSTSAKRRTIARWKERPPTVEELFRSEMLAAFHGKRLAEVIRKHERGHWDVSFADGKPYPDELFERARLSPSLYRACKAAGMDCGR